MCNIKFLLLVLSLTILIFSTTCCILQDNAAYSLKSDIYKKSTIYESGKYHSDEYTSYSNEIINITTEENYTQWDDFSFNTKNIDANRYLCFLHPEALIIDDTVPTTVGAFLTYPDVKQLKEKLKDLSFTDTELRMFKYLQRDINGVKICYPDDIYTAVGLPEGYEQEIVTWYGGDLYDVSYVKQPSGYITLSKQEGSQILPVFITQFSSLEELKKNELYYNIKATEKENDFGQTTYYHIDTENINNQLMSYTNTQINGVNYIVVETYGEDKDETISGYEIPVYINIYALFNEMRFMYFFDNTEFKLTYDLLLSLELSNK